MESLLHKTIVFLVVLFAAFTQGLTGIGFSMMSVPVLSKVMPLEQVVPVVVVLSLLANIMVISRSCHYVNIKKIWLLIVAGVAAAPLGAFLLVYVDKQILKIAAGLIVAVFSILQLIGKRFPVHREKTGFALAGILSGILNGSLSMSGPPVALFLSNQGVDRNTFRSNITFYALILNVITVIAFGANGLLTEETGSWLILLCTALIFGAMSGIAAVKFVNDFLFRRIVLVLITASGIWLLADSIRSM